MRGCDTYTRAQGQARGIGVHRRHPAAEALADEKQAQSEPEAEVCRS